LSFEIWIFRSAQPDCDDDHSIVVAMTSTFNLFLWEMHNQNSVCFYTDNITDTRGFLVVTQLQIVSPSLDPYA